VLALRSEPALVTIGKLQAELRGIWLFKQEAEEDLRGFRDVRKCRLSCLVRPCCLSHLSSCPSFSELMASDQFRRSRVPSSMKYLEMDFLCQKLMLPKYMQIATLEAKLHNSDTATSDAQEACDRAVMHTQAAEAARDSAYQEAQSQITKLGVLNEDLVKECKVCAFHCCTSSCLF
jgi:hypothetical protein